MAKILIADDDAPLCGVIRNWLSLDHHHVEVVNDGDSAVALLKASEFDLIVLDVNMPGKTGIDVLRWFRATRGKCPVLLLTGNDTIADIELGFESGADDYLKKPFHGKELTARIKALLRRPPAMLGNVLTFANLVLDRELYKVTRNGEEISLLPKEFALLEFFMRNPNRVFTAEALLNRVWHSESDATTEAVTTCIKRLRQKIDSDDVQSLIRTIRGAGYKLEEP